MNERLVGEEGSQCGCWFFLDIYLYLSKAYRFPMVVFTIVITTLEKMWIATVSCMRERVGKEGKKRKRKRERERESMYNLEQFIGRSNEANQN